MTETKWCPRCEDDLPISDFYKNIGRGDGLSGICVECHRKECVAYQLKIRQEQLALFGSKCGRCGFDDVRALEIDHVVSVGAAKVRVVWTRKFVNYLRDHMEDFQLLCANCHAIKTKESGERVGRKDGRTVPTERLPGKERDYTEQGRKMKEWYTSADPKVLAARASKIAAARQGTKLIEGKFVRTINI